MKKENRGKITIQYDNETFHIYYNGYEFLTHSKKEPIITVGTGHGVYNMRHGNFKISDKIEDELTFHNFDIQWTENKLEVLFTDDKKFLKMICEDNDDRLHLRFKTDNYNRFTINMKAYPDEHIYGCGEQYSILDLKGKKLPIWCQEQGIGRGKDLLTFLVNITHGAGGDWYTTYYPQPSFISSKNYFCHIETYYYSEFDFSNPNIHRLHIWSIPDTIILNKKETAPQIIENLSNYLGRQPKLPEWVYNGLWIGIQGGKNIVKDKLDTARKFDIKVGAVWVQDWEGERITSFGKQLMWNWKYDEELYPDLPTFIKKLNSENIKFLGYINPFLALEKELYKEASDNSYVVKDEHNKDNFVHITTFPAAQLDLSNEDTVKWIKKIIKENMIDIGLSGWMADFGEYLPMNSVLRSKETTESFHNKYPVLWAKANREIIDELGKINDTTFFSRSGFTGSSKYSPIIWAGDQNVNWSMDDGLATVIIAGISLGFSGIGIYHSDIGGYTTVAWLKRSKELLMRWTEHAAFTLIMRTHEGNKPEKNWQFDSDEQTLKHFAKMTKVYIHMKEYMKHIVNEYVDKGLPAMRHLYIHYENDETLHSINYQYLFGRDILVAPVYKPKKTKWEVYLPDDEWLHIWTNKEYNKKGWITVDAPLGCPPVFYRKKSDYAKIFQEIKNIH